MSRSSNYSIARLSIQDKKDLDKFTKFFTYKSLQIIVQSRLGEKINSKSKPFSSGTDWFNLAIRDIPEVQVETKKALSGQQLVAGPNHVCVEISLKTTEGDTMVLETWHIGMSEQCDYSAKVSYAVYNRMGIALKSVFSVSRVTPAYKLSCRQGADNYVICYKVYCGEPQFFHLGDGYQTAKIGTVPTPIGTITLNIAYRVKLLISPQRSSRDIHIEVKDDHFKTDCPPRKLSTAPKPCRMGYRRESASDELGLEDGQDLCSTSFSTSPMDGIVHSSTSPGSNKSLPHEAKAKSTDETDNSIPVDKKISFSNFHKIGAFAQCRVSKDAENNTEDIPFSSLLQTSKPEPQISSDKESSTSSDKTLSGEDMSGSLVNSMESNKSASSQVSAPDDFVMIELKTPFAAGTDANSDLGKFYRECQGAPSLNMFDQASSETIDQLTDQLAVFEAKTKDFDAFVNSLHIAE